MRLYWSSTNGKESFHEAKLTNDNLLVRVNYRWLSRHSRRSILITPWIGKWNHWADSLQYILPDGIIFICDSLQDAYQTWCKCWAPQTYDEPAYGLYNIICNLQLICSCEECAFPRECWSAAVLKPMVCLGAELTLLLPRDFCGTSEMVWASFLLNRLEIIAQENWVSEDQEPKICTS